MRFETDLGFLWNLTTFPVFFSEISELSLLFLSISLGAPNEILQNFVKLLIIYLRGHGVNLERFQSVIFDLETFSRFLSFNHSLTSSYIVTQYLQKLSLFVYETSWMYRAYTKKDVVKVLIYSIIFCRSTDIFRYCP